VNATPMLAAGEADLELVRADPLPGELAGEWSRIQGDSAALKHPMLSAAFVQAVARHRTDVEVGVIRSGSEVLGFFPFQRERGGTGKPVGHLINDVQGPILAQDIEVSAEWLLRECRLSTWHFDHLIPVRGFERGQFVLHDAPYIDLSDGLDAYLSGLGDRARWKSHERNEQRLARDVGPVRFEFHSTDDDAFRSLIAWKSEQFRLHGRRCVFDWPWVQGVLDELRSGDDPACAGTLSVLYAGDELAAVHFGVRSREVLHWWITTYNQELSKYSPGMLLLARVIEEAPSRGLERIDLGKGAEPYKLKLQSGAVPLASGALCRSALSRMIQRARYTVQGRLEASPLGAPAKRLAHWLEARVKRAR
jgi:CelD/BcsL family acetyltransferase involved in cellulose biosynthesis